MFNNFLFPEIRAVYEIIGKIFTAGKATDDNLAHAHFMLDI